MTILNGSYKSWNVNKAVKRETNHYGRSSWEKLRLLLWKNFTIQRRHIAQTIGETLLPLLFTVILVIIRVIVPSTLVAEPTIYTSFPIEHNPPYDVLFRCDRIYYSPSNNFTDTLMQKVNDDFFYAEGLQYNFTGFATEEELVKAYELASQIDDGKTVSKIEEDTTTPVLGTVIFENDFVVDGLPSNIKYKLRFPTGLRSDFDVIEEKFGLKASWFTEIVYPLMQLLGPRAKDKNEGGLPGYYTEGFLYVQQSIDKTIIRIAMESNPEQLKKVESQKIRLQRFPYPSYTNDKYLFALQAFLPLLMLLSFIYPVINISKSIVYEKEKRLKESMKMMGLSNWLHWTAWFIKSFISLTISCFLMTILLKVRLTESQVLPVIPYTDGTLIFFMFIVFSCSTICFCFFISSLFSSANPAATGAGALWILFYLPFAFLQPRYNLLPFHVKLLFCALTNTPISFACQIINMFEGTGEGLQWATVNEGSSPDDNFTMMYALLMMGFNGIVYLAAALYIEAVWPGEYGIPLPWNFFLKKWYWTGKARNEFEFDFNSNKAQANNFNIERPASKLKAGIEIKGLTKIFGKKTAVDQLNLDMYEGQITALLGHNGAGKTTTISILTGLFPPSSGTASVNGFDIHKDMDAIRSSLGICPQHDVLFDELTVAEHLQFFCLLKGMPKHLVDTEINRLLAALGLADKRNAQSRTLSGGMKRKLSVLIAFCANSKIVLLDECTSGMDLGSRRITWDLIQKEKQGRTIILSTHYMEEADVLGDRLAIMAEGDLQCCGSSLFLKKRYGGGYHLIICKSQKCVVENITKLLKKSVPEVEIDQNVGAELSYCLPDSKSSLFPAIFEELEARKEELGIDSYGASITTMEEVFMKVLRDAESSKSSANREDLDLVKNTSSVDLSHLDDSNHGTTSLLFSKDCFERNSGISLLIQQFWSMLVKKMIYAYRKRTLLLFQMTLPITYTAVLFIVLNAWPGFHNPGPLRLSLDKYESVGKTITVLNCLDDSLFCDSYADFVGEHYNVKNLNGSTTFNDYILDKANQSLTTVNFRYILGYEERLKLNKDNSTSKEIIGYFNNQPFHTPPLALNFITNAILRSANISVSISNHPLPLSKLEAVKEQGGILTLGFQLGYNTVICISFLTSTFIVFVVQERISGCKHLQSVSGVRFLLFWVASFIVDFINFILPCFGILFVVYCFQMEEFISLDMQINFIIIMATFGFAIIPFTYVCSFMCSNPTTGYAQLVIAHMFSGIAPMLTIVFTGLPELGLQKLVDEMNKYFLISPNYAMGMGIVQLASNYQFRQYCSLLNLEFICSSYPDNICCSHMKENYFDWERMGIGRNLVYLISSGCIYIFILILIEVKIFSKIRNLFRRTKEIVEEEPQDLEDEVGLEDSDVLAENEKIRKTDLNGLFNSHNVVVRDLKKMYSKFVAVDKINFGVEPGECFGLLGVNGAGKTTTFKMLTGDIPATNGDAFVCGKSIRKEIREVHASLGYTPQFDGLIGEMSGRECIRMFARLRGIPERYIDGLIAELGQVLLFSQHLDKEITQLSGGNKRKVSTACALVGKPSVVLLDEPSSGMDPVARRHLWNAVSTVRNAGTSVVLTSHSLEEAENLCTKIAIMVNGKFRCLGSPQHLKNKFSKGYTLIAQTPAKMHEDSEPFTRDMEEQGRRRSSVRKRGASSPDHWETALDELRAYIENAFPGCILKDIHPGFVHYHVMPSEDTSWGKMFAIMEQARVKFQLEAYSVGQTSLEQVFLNFTKTQINNE